MTAPRFTADNTAGYTRADLAALNAEFARLCAEAGANMEADDMASLSQIDWLAEQAERNVLRAAGGG